jgi:hypothetical protein
MLLRWTLTNFNKVSNYYNYLWPVSYLLTRSGQGVMRSLLLTSLWSGELVQISNYIVNPCGGGVEYLHREPASRKRRRNGTKKGRAIA